MASRSSCWTCQGSGRSGSFYSRAALGRDDGAAIVEFVMVSVLLIFLLFGVLQIAAVFYVRNIIAASVADAARYAASADVAAEEGALRATRLITRSLSPTISHSIVCTSSLTTDDASGLQTVFVRCRGNVKSIFLPIGAFVGVDVSAHALKEGA
jgi:Flp pilus assembly protein TadG